MNLGIVGTGGIVHGIGPHLSSWGISVSAIAGTPRSHAKTVELAKALGASACYDDYRLLIEDPQVDTVYVAVPNSLHYDVARTALMAGKDVICEKPLTSTEIEATELAELARSQQRYLWEAVVTTRQPNFRLIRDELLPRIGAVKVATVNYSQYSSRYDAFRAGTVLPAFDPTKSGGAIMDLGLYTLTFTIGLFGEPLAAAYHANIERGIDTSGVITLDYGDFKAINICAKDCDALCFSQIQGVDGYLVSMTKPNSCGAITLHLNDGTEEHYDRSLPVMWEGEFREFLRQQQDGDLAECYRQLETSLTVSRVQNAVRRGAGIVFPADDLR
ncbi:MAG: Gfo/Idh/MocA family oxidoreductase [Atopobiaceae bacterium]|nr:Gfo/Idh/MocA family oxidoreductase [Atopobiaceae bacterium]